MSSLNQDEKKTDDLSVGMPKPSPLVRRFAQRIASAAGHAPVLDDACGTGRNVIIFYYLGCMVVGVDKDLTRFNFQNFQPPPERGARLCLGQLDLFRDAWPF